jgi:hypothetical protein
MNKNYGKSGTKFMHIWLVSYTVVIREQVRDTARARASERERREGERERARARARQKVSCLICLIGLFCKLSNLLICLLSSNLM